MSYFYLNQIITSTLPLNREYMIIPIIPIWAYIYIYTKTTSLITLLAKNIAGKIFNQKRIQKEKYEMKGENKTTIKTKITE